MSRTVSARLQNEVYEQLIRKCNERGLTVNEFLKEWIKVGFYAPNPKNYEISKPVKNELSAKDLAKILGINMRQ